MKYRIFALVLFLALSISLSAFSHFAYRPAYFVGDSFTVRMEDEGSVHPEIAPEYRANAFLSRDGALPEPYVGGVVQVGSSLTFSGFGLLLHSLKVNGREIDWSVGERHWASPHGYSVRVDQPVQRIIPGSISRSIGLFAERYIHALDVLCYAAIVTLFLFSFWYAHLDIAYVYMGFMGTVIGVLNSNNTMGSLMPIGLPQELIFSEAMLGFSSALGTTLVALALWLIKLVAFPEKTWMWRSQE
jgi:hypothetical protein